MWDEAAKQFKFDLGDEVIHKTTAHHGATALRYVVVERTLAQCHGGIQRLYLVRATFQDSAFSHREHAMESFQGLFNETEVIAAPTPESEMERAAREIEELKARVRRSSVRIPEDKNAKPEGQTGST